MTDKYAVIGNPIDHSKSPMIHAAFAKQTGEDIQYDRLFSDVDAFSNTVKSFITAGGKGLNVTVPFKLDALNFAHSLTKRAQHAAAVNTLVFNHDGTVLGDNTDGIGFVRDVTDNLGISLEKKQILVLGAGGAVRGILPKIAEMHPESITIANRTPDKAIKLADKTNALVPSFGLGMDELNGKSFDIIINGSSAGLTGELPDLPASILANCELAYDLVYAPADTDFVRWAKQSTDTTTADGIGMLVEQAAESFYLWRNVMPDTRTVIDQLSRLIKNQ